MNSIGLLAVTVSHSEGTSNISDSEAEASTPRPVEYPKSSQPPRREVRWVNLGANSPSLDSIAHHFQDYIDCFLSSSSSTLRRIRALDYSSAFHPCPGYLREEITLTAEVSKSAIVSSAFADLGERCSFCGDLVDIDFERDFGQWFAPDETEGLQRFRDQEKEDQKRQRISPYGRTSYKDRWKGGSLPLTDSTDNWRSQLWDPPNLVPFRARNRKVWRGRATTGLLKCRLFGKLPHHSLELQHQSQTA